MSWKISKNKRGSTDVRLLASVLLKFYRGSPEIKNIRDIVNWFLNNEQPQLKLWQLSPGTRRIYYDMYSTCVVTAYTEEEARLIHPSGSNYDARNWCPPNEVNVQYLGVTDRLIPGEVICSSYNGG